MKKANISLKMKRYAANVEAYLFNDSDAEEHQACGALSASITRDDLSDFTRRELRELFRDYMRNAIDEAQENLSNWKITKRNARAVEREYIEKMLGWTAR